jgi:hypothetical protein
MVLASQEGRAPVGDTGRAAAGTPRQAVPAQGPQPADAQAQGPRTRGSPPRPARLRSAARGSQLRGFGTTVAGLGVLSGDLGSLRLLTGLTWILGVWVFGVPRAEKTWGVSLGCRPLGLPALKGLLPG